MSEELVRSAHLPGQHRFHFLDALRGIAAFLVVIRHVPNGFTPRWFQYNSFLAVDFFFCLSGFVIGYSYEKKLLGSMSLKVFTTTRLVRLLPIATLATLIGAVNKVFSSHHGTFALPYPLHVAALTLLGLIMVPVPVGVALFPLVGTMWTLFLELIANGVYGVMIRMRLAGRWVLLSIMAVSFAVIVWHCWPGLSLDTGFSMRTLHVGLGRVGLSFFGGILIYRLFLNQKPSDLHNWRASLGALVITILLVATLLSPQQLILGGNALYLRAVSASDLVRSQNRPTPVDVCRLQLPGDYFISPLSSSSSISGQLTEGRGPTIWTGARNSHLVARTSSRN